MSFGELVFLSLLALLVFGPRKLPEIARLVGKTMAELRRASNEFRNSLEDEIRNAELQEQAKKASVTFTPTPAVPAIAPPEPENTEAPAPLSDSLTAETEPEGQPSPRGLPGTVPAPEDPWVLPERHD